MPPQYRPDSTEIILDPKDMSSENTAWKGAAILSSLVKFSIFKASLDEDSYTNEFLHFPGECSRIMDPK